MDFLLRGLGEAFDLVVSGDHLVFDAAARSLWVSSLAVLLAGLLGIPVGLALARGRFPGRSLLVVLARAGMSLPTVLIGLLGWGLLSHRGPLGGFDLLYSPGAIVAGELVLALPIVVTWTQGAIRKLDPLVFETVRTLGLGVAARGRAATSRRRASRSRSPCSPPSRAASPSSASR